MTAALPRTGTAQHVGPLTQEEQAIQAQQLTVQGMTQSFLGYHDRAISLFEQALRFAPSSAALNSALAESYEHLDDLNTAIFYAGQALTLAPDQLYYHRHLIHLYIRSNDTQKAETQLVQLLQLFPDDVDTIHDLIGVQMSNERYQEALNALDRLSEKTGRQAELIELQLEIYDHLQDWDNKESLLLDLRTQFPEEPYYGLQLGQLYETLERLDDAVLVYEEVLTLAPADPYVTRALDRLKRPASGEQAATPEEAYLRANQLMSQPNADTSSISSARELLEYALSLSPEYVDALTALGQLLFEEQVYQESGPLLERAVNLNPRSIELWVRAARSHLYAGTVDEGASIAEEALLLFPGHPSLLYTSALCHMRLGHTSRAADRLAAYFQYQDDSETESRIELDRALSMVQEALDTSENNPAYLDFMGWIYLKRGALDQAEQWLTSSLRTDNAPASAYDHYGDLLLQQGKPQEAVSSWNKALELDPDNPILQEKLNLHAN